MAGEGIVRFTVQIVSTNNGTWQGVVSADHASYWFQSEMQMLRWLCERYPVLLPSTNEENWINR